MKGIITREIDQTYFILEDFEPQEHGYSMSMTRNCPLDSLLPCSLAFCNGQRRLRYRITGLISLPVRFSDIPVRSSDIRSLLYTLRDLCLRLPEYLLDPEDLLIIPENVFISPGDNRTRFCYIPDLHTSESENRKLLAEFLIRHVDHSDQEAMELAYSFYDKVSEDSCPLSEAISASLSTLQTDSDRGQPRTAIQYSDSSRIDIHETGTSNADPPSVHPKHGIPHEVSPSSCSQKNFPPEHPGENRRFAPGRRSVHPTVPKVIRQKHEHDRKILVTLAVIAFCLASLAAVLFRIDAAQLGGIGFLAAAVIWLVRQQQMKKESELQNIWSDEEQEMEDDDSFYQSLLNEVYANSPVLAAQVHDGPVQTNQACDSQTHRKQVHDRPVHGSPIPGSSVRGSPVHSSPVFDRQTSSYASSAAPSDTLRSSTMASPDALRSSAPSLRSMHAELYNDIPLRKSLLLIGKNARECDICLKSDTVSRIHAKIEQTADAFYLTDLFSTNGTFLDGKKLQPNHAACLHSGSEVQIADHHYIADL